MKGNSTFKTYYHPAFRVSDTAALTIAGDGSLTATKTYFGEPTLSAGSGEGVTFAGSVTATLNGSGATMIDGNSVEAPDPALTGTVKIQDSADVTAIGGQ